MGKNKNKNQRFNLFMKNKKEKNIPFLTPNRSQIKYDFLKFHMIEKNKYKDFE